MQKFNNIKKISVKFNNILVDPSYQIVKKFEPVFFARIVFRSWSVSVRPFSLKKINKKQKKRKNSSKMKSDYLLTLETVFHWWPISAKSTIEITNQHRASLQ